MGKRIVAYKENETKVFFFHFAKGTFKLIKNMKMFFFPHLIFFPEFESHILAKFDATHKEFVSDSWCLSSNTEKINLKNKSHHKPNIGNRVMNLVNCYMSTI